EPQQVALLVAPIYGVLHLMSAFASRNAFRLSGWANGDDAAARWMWIAFTTLFAVVAVAGWFGWNAALIVGFVLLYTLQNAWRPALVARINAAGDDSQAATVLSIENQAQRTVTMIAAPAMGLIIDTVIARGVGHPFWPLGIAGTVIGIGFVLRSLKRAASPELSTT
ncbi:MAG: hypothetical protein O3A46_06780, partial [Candidatus Poribacteria bacterium]|nr:hypothetical protein [Candidatus Poribacteria bacterium]